MKKTKVKEILILGIGNILHKDDGIGVHVIN
jgi:Ni,Fe-hydrogenase maturation factor